MTAFTSPLNDGAHQYRLARRALTIAFQTCNCPDHYHTLWAAMRAAGRHRGLLTESAFLRDLIAPRLRPGARLLIAGAADAGSFELLSAIAADMPVRFTVVDRCPAPLRLVDALAAEAGVSVETIACDLTDLPARRHWDLAFLHYTLSFMDAPTRQRVIRGLAAGLTPDGVIVCGVKRIGVDEPGSTGPDAWVASTRERLSVALADAPEQLRALESVLARQPLRRAAIVAKYAGPDTIADECVAAGLSVLERYADPAGAGEPVARDQGIGYLVLGRAD